MGDLNMVSEMERNTVTSAVMVRYRQGMTTPAQTDREKDTAAYPHITDAMRYWSYQRQYRPHQPMRMTPLYLRRGVLVFRNIDGRQLRHINA